ncbi:Svp26 protein [Martiniozyma asiatica (nom. inval.)]|nr:Svp26 protein [Martiniozyma asiatica]
MIIQALAVFGYVFGFISITLSIAAGLYYFSEIIEENIEFTRRALKRTILAVVIVIISLWIFDGFPFWLSLFSIFSHYVYHLNLRKFPQVEATNPIFIATCILALLNHYLWFRHFNNPYIPTIDERLSTDFKMPHYPSFAEVASFFGLCIWFTPFALFISISSNEAPLPLSNNDLNGDSDTERVKKSVNLVRSIITKSLSTISEYLGVLGINFKFGRSRTDSRNPNDIYI